MGALLLSDKGQEGELARFGVEPSDDGYCPASGPNRLRGEQQAAGAVRRPRGALNRWGRGYLFSQ